MQVSIPEYKAQIGGGIFFSALALLLYFVIIPREIVFEQQKTGVSPAYFPNLLSGLLFIFAVALGVDGYRSRLRKNQQVYTFSLREVKMVAIALAIIALQTLAFDRIGYLVPAIVAIAACMLVFGHKSYLTVVLLSVGLPIAIKLFFEKMLQVTLP
jgi:membrane-associated HD superfamily phosphohydrolase